MSISPRKTKASAASSASAANPKTRLFHEEQSRLDVKVRRILKSAGVDEMGNPHYRAVVWDSRTQVLPVRPVLYVTDDTSTVDALKTLGTLLCNISALQDHVERIQTTLLLRETLPAKLRNRA